MNPCGLQAGQCVVAPTGTTGSYCGSGAATAYGGCYNGLNGAPSNYYGNGWYNGPSYGPSYGQQQVGCPAGQYQIKSGDTFYSLGNYNNGGACTWVNANTNVNPCKLTPGQCVNNPNYSNYQNPNCWLSC